MAVNDTDERTAIITNVQKFTIHDGPGIRTEIFFKGCPLKCLWCSNPETVNKEREVGVISKDCVGIGVCGACIKVCRAGALLTDGEKVVGIDREKCKGCLRCANSCPSNALKIYGKVVTVKELMKEIIKDRSFYQKSGGGVTLSGGDCLQQVDFVVDLLKECKRAGIHTCIETELSCSTEVLDMVLPYVDLIMTDIKHMDPLKHRKYTGVDNKNILKNIKYLSLKNVPLVVRIPVVSGYNDDPENLKSTAEFLKQYVRGTLRQLQLLPYRPLGIEKYESLNREYPMKDYDVPKPEEYLDKIRKLAKEFQVNGIPAVAGTTVKIN